MRYQLVVSAAAVAMACSGGNDANRSEPTIGVVDVDGVQFRYVREGRGTPAVVVGSSVYYPRAYSDNLRDHFDLIFVDSRHFMPSFQPSETELEGLTLNTWADDVEAIRARLGIDQWVVFGHSVHAQIALAYAQRYPQRTSRLVLIAGVPYAGEDVDEAGRRLWNEQASAARKDQHTANTEGLDSALAAAPPGRRFVVSYMAGAARYWADPTYDSGPLWEGVQAGPALGRFFGLIPSRAEVRRALEAIDMPTLVILGKRDYAIPYTVWEPLIADLPNVTYILLEEDSHNPQTEAPQRFDPVLLDWLAK